MTQAKRRSVKKNPLEGVEFADETPEEAKARAEGTEIPQRSEERDRLNNQSQAAKDFLKSQQLEPEKHMPPLKVVKAEPLSPEEEQKIKPRYYQVLETHRMTTYTLPAGKVFSENEYDVESLIRAGVKLEEIEPSSISVRPRV